MAQLVCHSATSQRNGSYIRHLF
uniref:Uncharacterized protein n=1 Tax=Rhizophora mucronata TaxID=61149 RepID=A0A2P2Q745_RHIMU